MLGQLGGWDDDLGRGNVVVWKEDNLEEVTDVTVRIDNRADSVDELDDDLGVVVSWSSLTSDHDDSWDELGVSLTSWGVLDAQVTVHDVENVEELSLVLVNSLYLDVVKRVKWDINSCVLLDPLLETEFILLLDLSELAHETSIG